MMVHLNARSFCQEDLCLMKRTDKGWVLSAASSSSFQMEPVGQDRKRLDHIHQPVTGYRKYLSKKVDTFLIVWEKSQFRAGIGSCTLTIVCINHIAHPMGTQSLHLTR